MMNRKRSRFSASQSAANQLRVKLRTLVSRHHELKTSFQSLKSQVQAGLVEADDVFSSMAVPLMKLVGLKAEEMAEEGRFSTIVIETDSPQSQGGQRTGLPYESPSPSTSHRGREEINNLTVEKNYATKATRAGKELVEKQHIQFVQLVQLLKQIEENVNSHQNDILQTLANHRISIQNFFQKAGQLLSDLHSQNRDTFPVTVKLLRAIFDNMGSVFGSVETGVEDLMQGLAEDMCTPMVRYVKCLKADMGTCSRLLTMVEEMETEIKDGRIELEEARKRVRVAEEQKMEALYILNETEERVRTMKQQARFPPEAKKGPREPCVPLKVLGMEKEDLEKDDTLFWDLILSNKEKDDKLLWELLISIKEKEDKLKYQTPESSVKPREQPFSEPMNKQYKYQTPESSMGPREIPCSEPMNKQQKTTREVKPVISQRPVTRSYLRGRELPLQVPQTRSFDTRIPLSSSPSSASHGLGLPLQGSQTRPHTRSSDTRIPLGVSPSSAGLRRAVSRKRSTR